MLLIAVVFSVQANAQKVITFDQSSNSGNHRQKNEVKKNSLTVGLISPVNGYFPMYYERNLTAFLSLQVGAGVTFRSFGNDFGQMIWNDGKNSEFVDNGPDNFSNVEDQYQHYRYRKAMIGTYFSVSPKIYFSDECMNGFFLAPAFELKNYKNKAQLANESKTTEDMIVFSDWTFEADDRDIPHVAQTVQEDVKCMDITLNIGGHYQLKNNLVLGWNTGIGLRSMKSSRLDIYTESDGISASYFRNTIRDYESLKPLFTVNLVIGGGF